MLMIKLIAWFVPIVVKEEEPIYDYYDIYKIKCYKCKTNIKKVIGNETYVIRYDHF